MNFRTGAPRVSVCMPVYNGAEYIREAIESVLAQTFGDLELLVGDNCSTDETEAVVRRFGDTRIRYERNETNLGPAGNVNRLLGRAAGGYVAIFHHDDVMLPENLERKVRLLDQHPEIGFVYSNMVLIDPAGVVVQPHSWDESSRRDSRTAGFEAFRKFVDRVPLGSSIFIGTVVARRSCYESLGDFRKELPHCHDTEMWMRMLLFYDVACLGEPLVKYRVHPSSASSAFGDYETIGYLSEHHSAVQMIFDRWSGRIPEADALKKRLDRAFAVRALQFALSAFQKRDAATGRRCMREAVRMDPGIRRSSSFWRATAHRMAGPNVMRLLRATRGSAAAASR